MKTAKWMILLALIGGIVAAGCDSNPTNEPNEEAIKKADENRIAAIDNDPNLTPQQKEEMKKHMSFSRNAGGEGRK